MDNLTINETQPKQREFRDYLIIFLQHKWTVFAIFAVAFAVAVFYALSARSVYTAQGSIKITIPRSNLLSGPLFEQFQEFGSDRYIANELEILKSRTISEFAAKYILDSLNKPEIFTQLYLTLKDLRHPEKGLKNFEPLSRTLKKRIKIEQKRGLDIILFKSDSPSPVEAAYIVNAYINAYYEYNLKSNRTRFTLTREFLEKQREDKANQLKEAENRVSEFQKQTNVVALDEQATKLVQQISDFESQMKAAEIEAASKQKALEEFRKTLSEKDKEISKYIESLAAEPYIKTLQEQIARLEVQKEVVIAQQNLKNPENDPNVIQYANSIRDLQQRLNSKLTQIESSLTAYTPSELRQLSTEVLKLDLEVKSALARATELKNVLKSFEARFNQLPAQSIQFARLERERLSNEKLYLLLEEKYQEAVISERSIPSNVEIIDPARVPNTPSKPNRKLIVIIGFILGFGLAAGFVFLKKFFDVVVRTPEDVQNYGANVLSWIPDARDFEDNFDEEHEIIVLSRPESIPTEAFLSAKMKLQFAKLLDKPIKSILVTSPTPKDGKTFIAANLAATFAMTNQKVALIDLDLRKPRLHKILKSEKIPGLTDFLFNKLNISDIIKTTLIKNVDFIPSGTMAPNPAEIVTSKEIQDFLKSLYNNYDIIIIDSPPTIAVSDSGVLSNYVDATILVASVNQTRLDLIKESITILKSVSNSFAGVILNKFNMTNGYGSYYKYYYYYYGSDKRKNKKAFK